MMVIPVRQALVATDDRTLNACRSSPLPRLTHIDRPPVMQVWPAVYCTDTGRGRAARRNGLNGTAHPYVYVYIGRPGHVRTCPLLGPRRRGERDGKRNCARGPPREWPAAPTPARLSPSRSLPSQSHTAPWFTSLSPLPRRSPHTSPSPLHSLLLPDRSSQQALSAARPGRGRCRPAAQLS